MKHLNVFPRVLACVLLASSGAASAQHAGHPVASPAPSPYAGQQAREIKAFSPAQTADLLAGKGMEQAKAAELNGYPGPMHVLELAGPLALSASQRQDSEALLAGHKAEARALGARLVDAERELDTAFAGKRIDPAQLDLLTRRIGLIQAELRASHLRAHLRQAGLLTPAQVALYAELRGYTGEPATTAPGRHSSH